MASFEEQPLLQPIRGDSENSLKSDETDLSIEFDPNGDSDDPRQWPAMFKWAMVLLLAGMAFTVTFTCISVVPIANRIVKDLTPQDGSQQRSASSALLVTIWELGEAAGPLLIAPLSEVFGRYPVINICNILFITCTLTAAFSPNVSLLIVARALTGLTVTSAVLNPAIIGDMFESDQRGSAMSLLMLAPLIGGAIGPAISGGITEALGWRWVLLIAACLAGTCELLFLTCFRETYKMKILRKRAARLGLVAPSKAKEEGKLWSSITRPFEVLFGSAVLLMLSLFGSVAFSYYYVISISLPEILQEVYGFSPAKIGAAFMCFSIGSFFGVVLCNAYLDKIYITLRAHSSNPTHGKPEHRLPLAILGAFTLPLAVTAYGCVARLHLPVYLLLSSVGAVGLTLLLVIIPLSAYVVDAYKLYSASAMTGIIVIRCLMSTFFPLTIEPLVGSLGFGWGFAVLGAIALACAPVPVFVFGFGEKWRQKSKFTRDEGRMDGGDC